jgi:hypothetical protein
LCTLPSLPPVAVITVAHPTAGLAAASGPSLIERAPRHTPPPLPHPPAHTPVAPLRPDSTAASAPQFKAVGGTTTNADGATVMAAGAPAPAAPQDAPSSTPAPTGERSCQAHSLSTRLSLSPQRLPTFQGPPHFAPSAFCPTCTPRTHLLPAPPPPPPSPTLAETTPHRSWPHRHHDRRCQRQQQRRLPQGCLLRRRLPCPGQAEERRHQHSRPHR